MIKFYTNTGFGSGVMRGYQIANKLNELGIEAEFTNDIRNEKNSTIVVVKNGNPLQLMKAKQNGCRIIYDLVDKLARKIFPIELDEASEIPDKRIHCSEFSKHWWGKYLGKDDWVIPHHWDERIKPTTHDKLKIGYVGHSFNTVFTEHFPEIKKVTQSDNWLEGISHFNLHYNIRDPRDDLLKPATKITAAAGAGANIITLRNPIAMELLGEDYPYFVGECSPQAVEIVMQRAKREFNGSEWKRGLELMARVKEQTALDNVIRDYERYLGGV